MMKNYIKIHKVINLLLLMSMASFYCYSQATSSSTIAPDGTIYVGAAYYPEHWPKERWETDVKLMRDAGFNIVRLAEFAWVNMEPSEGNYDFQWLDDAIALFGKYNMKVILGTPTAVMPAWLAHKYPEAMAMNRDGSRIDYGARKNNCFTNQPYLSKGNELIEHMTQRYGSNPVVIGWQTDNELSGPTCHCNSCLGTFQSWVKEKYGSLDNLNEKWGTRFWGHTVHSWDEITFPECEGDGNWQPSGNPSLCLDWKRFHTHLQVRFQSDQIDIIRKHDPNAFITHNLMGLHDNIDYYELSKDLDFVSWDNYPVWGKPDVPVSASLAADVMRGMKQKNFWIMEQTAGPTGWGSFGRNVRPGELKKICYQQLAHGADAQIWFRWRTATVGREQYWHGILGHDGKPGRRYQEAAQLASEYKKLEKVLSGTTVKSDVAIIYDYENIWSVQGQKGYITNSVREAIMRYYNALFKAGINVDIIHRDADFKKYKVVFAPGQTIVPDAMAKRINQYVKDGGILIADSRFAIKDEYNLMHERTLPGLLTETLGIEIEEYEAMNDFTYPFVSSYPIQGSYKASQYSDWIKLKGASSPAGYTDWHMVNYAPFTINKFGNGLGIYIGTIVGESSFYEKLIDYIAKEANVEAELAPLEGVEVSVREGNSKKILFIINHTEESKNIKLPNQATNLLTNQVIKDNLDVGKYGVAVLDISSWR